MVEKFTLSSNKLQMILDNQKAVCDKVGLGYNALKKQKFLKNIFMNSSSNKFLNITCFKCVKNDTNPIHISLANLKILMWRKYGFQKEPLWLTKKDPRKFGYLKSKFNFYMQVCLASQ